MSMKFTKFFFSWSFLLIPLICLLIKIPLHTGYKEEYVSYFINAALISILLVTFTTKSFTTHIIKSGIGLFLIVWATGLFWGYMDHPWFAGPETNTCDGACFGWFSFENDDPSVTIAIGGTILLFLTGITKATVLFIKNKLSKSIKGSNKVT